MIIFNLRKKNYKNSKDKYKIKTLNFRKDPVTK